MNKNYYLLPILLVGGLLLAACASTLTATPSFTNGETPIVFPSETPVLQGNPKGDPGTKEEDDPEPSPSVVPPQPTPTQPEEDVEYNIIALLPPDAIPAIFNPEFLPIEEADQEYDADEQVMGVVIDGDARAYSVGHLSSHEIVNDTVGGRKIAVTW